MQNKHRRIAGICCRLVRSLPEGFIPYNYLTAAKGFYELFAAERLTEPNLACVRLLIRQPSRRVGPPLRDILNPLHPGRLPPR